MPVTTENFDQLKIDKLKHFLEDMADKGQPRPYEIFVDALKVVPKNSDPANFENYDYYLNEDSEKIRILIYNTNQSPRNDQYNFLVQKNKQEKSANGLGEIDAIIQEKLSAREKEYEFAKLQGELAEAKKQLEESEEYAESLELQLEEAKTNKYKLGNINVAELASITLEGMIRRNPQMLAKIPGGEALAGIIEEDNLDAAKKQLAPTTAEGEASFQKQEKGTESLTESQKRHLHFFSMLEEKFTETQLDDVMQIIHKFAEEPAQMPIVKELLNI